MQKQVILTDADVTRFLASKQDDDVIGEKHSCLLYRAMRWKYPHLHVWVSTVTIESGVEYACDFTQVQTSKQQEQVWLHDELARSGPVTKKAFLDAWNASWCATVEWK